jgi:3-phenylpropionate/trans-cinnamate dioxygenase ferredoxin subunit
MAQRHKVARLSELPPGTMKGVAAGLTPVLLANVDGQIYAVSGLCSHLYVPLSLGRLDGCIVTCLAHGSRFDVRTGEVDGWVTTKFPLGAEQLLRLKQQKNLATYPVIVEGDDVFVEV